jgi:HEAT repeat protein
MRRRAIHRWRGALVLMVLQGLYPVYGDRIAVSDNFVDSLQQEALPDLVASLTDRGTKKRLRIVRIAGVAQTASAREWLLRAYDETEAEGIRCKLLESLGHLHDPALLGWYAQRLEDPRIGIQCFAIWALGELRAPVAASVLSHKLWSPSRYVQMTALDALGKTGKNPATTEMIENFLREDDVQFRFIAAKALRGTAGEDAAPGLIARLMREPSLDVQDELAQTIGKIGGRTAVSHWIELLKNSPSAATEHWAILGLEASDPALVIPALAPLFEGDDISARISASRILDGLDASKAIVDRMLWIESVERWLHGSDPVAQEAAIRFMERIQDTQHGI